VEEWEIWNEEEVAKSEEKAKKLVPECFTSGSMYLGRSSQKGYLLISYGITQ